MAVEIPAEMLARLAQAAVGAVEREHILVMRDDVVGEFGIVRRLPGGDPARRGYRPREPGRAVMRAADHHRIGAGLRNDVDRVAATPHVTIGNDGDGDGLLDLGDRPPVSTSLIELAARA